MVLRSSSEVAQTTRLCFFSGGVIFFPLVLASGGIPAGVFVSLKCGFKYDVVFFACSKCLFFRFFEKVVLVIARPLASFLC